MRDHNLATMKQNKFFPKSSKLIRMVLTMLPMLMIGLGLVLVTIGIMSLRIYLTQK